MTDLADWLLAQIADDEQAARAARGKVEFHVIFDDDSSLTSQQVAHIARHDPARVLADCAAKRAIVELHGVKRTDSYGAEQFCDECGTGRRDWGPGDAADFYPTDWPCPTLRLLAQPYADRPGFDPAWKVET